MNAEAKKHPNITLSPVESRQIAAIGHDPATGTLAIRFKNWKGEPSSLYHYSGFTADDFEAFKGAESIGRHFGQHIKPAAEKYPYTRINETEPEAETTE